MASELGDRVKHRLSPESGAGGALIHVVSLNRTKGRIRGTWETRPQARQLLPSPL